jgi:hypothetical protein
MAGSFLLLHRSSQDHPIHFSRSPSNWRNNCIDVTYIKVADRYRKYFNFGFSYSFDSF